MPNPTRFFATLLLFFAACTSTPTTQNGLQTIELDTQQMDKLYNRASLYGQSFINQRADAVIGLMSPLVFEAMKQDLEIDYTMAATQKLLEYTFSEINDQKGQFKSFEIDEPSRVYATETHLLCKIPTLITYSRNDTLHHDEGEMVALSTDKGNTWYFIENDYPSLLDDALVAAALKIDLEEMIVMDFLKGE